MSEARASSPRWAVSHSWDPYSARAAAALSLVPAHSATGASAHAEAAHSLSREPGVVGLLLNGYLDAEIRMRVPGSPSAERFRWTLGAGSDRNDPLRSTPAKVRFALASLDPEADGRISVDWTEGDRRHYLAPGRSSLSAYVARHGELGVDGVMLGSAATLGSALRKLRDLDPACAEELPAPSGPRRLAHWLRTGDGPWGAAVMHDQLAAALGQSRIDEIVGWVDEMPQVQLVHGRAGFGATIVPESFQTPAAVLLGDEIAYGPWDFDLAWVLGDLLVGEHMTVLGHPEAAAKRQEIITECRDAFLIAYGPAADIVTAGRTTILRVLLELHDSAAYLDRQLTELAASAPELVDCAR